MKWLPLLFILLSCQKGGDLGHFESLVFEKVYQGEEVHLFPALKSGVLSGLPKKTWTPLISVKTSASGVCLLAKKEKNSYYLMLTEENQSCLQKIDRPMATLDNVENLKISFKSFRLNVEGWQQKGKMNWIFPIVNLTTSKISGADIMEAINRENYSFELSYLPGLRVGARKKVKSLADGTICKNYGKGCDKIEKFTCDQCENGWYEVIDSKCQHGYKGVCGQDRCGERNQPACLKGEFKSTKRCVKGSGWGFCQQGLSTFCREDGILICL